MGRQDRVNPRGHDPQPEGRGVGPCIVQRLPSETDFEALDRLAGAIAQKHKENGYE